MDLPVPHLLNAIALRAGETLQILIPLASLAVCAVLVGPQARGRPGWSGSAAAVLAALLVGATATYAFGRA